MNASGPAAVVADRGGLAIGRVEHHRPLVSGRPLRLGPRPPVLAGRHELLAELDARLSPDGGAQPRVIVLCGLGGAGKTTVALEYAHRHLAGSGLIWQLTADDRTSLLAGFGDLAAQMGARDLFDAADPVAQVHGMLATYADDWLLVFDNAASPADLWGMLPPAGRGRVLITSQNPHWPLGQVIEVPVLTRRAAAEFLLRRTGSADPRAAGELAGELGGLPLALEQAAAYMQATGRGIAGYLALFRDRRADLLMRGDPAGYDKHVSTTWALAFDELRRAGLPAIGLLRLLACCAPEAVPLSLIRNRPGAAGSISPRVAPMLLPLLNDPLAIDDAVAALRRYSLISSPHGGSVSMHRLVQAVTLAQLGDDEAAAWRQAAQDLIDAALPGDPERPQAWATCAALLPHAQAVLPPGSEGMAKIVTYLGCSGNYAAARALAGEVADDRQRTLGADHPSTLASRGDLAQWTGESGDAAGARDLFAALVPAYERVMGDRSTQTLAARLNLAKWTGDAGDTGSAYAQCVTLAAASEQLLGAEHPLTLITRATLAYWTGVAGDPAAARDQYAALLPALERVLGSGHLEVFWARDNMARWALEAGDAAGARDQYAALLSACERVLGATHPIVLGAREMLIRCTAHTGDYAAARDQITELIPVRERVLGAEHPYLLMARADLAFWTGMAGNPAEARDRLAGLLAVGQKLLGTDYPDIVIWRRDLAHWTGEAGDAGAARDQLAVIVPDCERVLGADHPKTLQARAWLAAWTGEAGDATAARDQLATLLPVRERVCGPDHPDTRDTRQSLRSWTLRASDGTSP